jgi:hypothetical protein
MGFQKDDIEKRQAHREKVRQSLILYWRLKEILWGKRGLGNVHSLEKKVVYSCACKNDVDGSWTFCLFLFAFRPRKSMSKRWNLSLLWPQPPHWTQLMSLMREVGGLPPWQSGNRGKQNGHSWQRPLGMLMSPELHRCFRGRTLSMNKNDPGCTGAEHACP